MSAQLDRILADGTITIAPWHDPIAADGIPTDSDDALIWLTPTLGPSAVLVLHRLARYLASPGPWDFSLVDLGGSFGLWTDTRTAPSPQLLRTFHRLESFGMIRTVGSHIEVRTMAPKLSQRWLERMPEFLSLACPYRA